MDGGLVDLSLFAVSPTNDHHFSLPERPLYRRVYNDEPWFSDANGLNRHTPRPCIMKPLPPLPRRRLCEIRPDPRRDDSSSRCILSRMRRMRIENHVERSAYVANTIQQRRTAPTAPHLTLSVPPTQFQQTSRQANPMVWMPDEEMWLVIDDRGFGTYAEETYPPPPTYVSAPYAVSEPSPTRASDFSPVRTQFLTLMDQRPRDDEISPLFQQAIHGVSMHEYADPNEPPTFQVEHDWRSQISEQEFLPQSPEREYRSYASGRESWHSALSEGRTMSMDSSAVSRLSGWDGMPINIQRSSTARYA